MSINLGTTEVVLGLYSKALQLATRARDSDAAARRFRRKGR